jgi:glycosyltransferase involved in cell wall biosynthesis
VDGGQKAGRRSYGKERTARTHPHMRLGRGSQRTRYKSAYLHDTGDPDPRSVAVGSVVLLDLLQDEHLGTVQVPTDHAARAVRILGIPEDGVTVIPNGVDTEYFRRLGLTASDRLALLRR